jgi:hypothetical protein
MPHWDETLPSGPVADKPGAYLKVVLRTGTVGAAGDPIEVQLMSRPDNHEVTIERDSSVPRYPPKMHAACSTPERRP